MIKKTCLLAFLVLGLCQCKPKLEGHPAPGQASPIPVGDNSQNSLDWEGTYRGFLPCQDCEGILTELSLDANGGYELRRCHWGRDRQVVSEKGTFRWDNAGEKISLSGPWAQGELAVGEDHLRWLSHENKTIAPEPAEGLVLRKAGRPNRLSGTYWRLVELQGQALETSREGKEAFLLIVPGSGQVSGNSGCNNLAGTCEVGEGFRIRFSKMASTRMACRGADTETALLQVFEMADSYALKGDTLSLNRARMAPLARFVAAFPIGQ